MKFQFYKQQDNADCGPTCLRMIIRHYGRNVSIQKLRKMCYTQRKGVTLLDLSEAAEKLGFDAVGANLELNNLTEENLPCILHWKRRHFVVLYRIKNKRYYLADPARGLIKLSQSEFIEHWLKSQSHEAGIGLLLTPKPEFFTVVNDDYKLNWLDILKYFFVYRSLFVQLILGLLVGSLLSLIAPFFTQAIVDLGIGERNIKIVYLILIAQFMLFFSSVSVNFIRSWVLLHISSRVNLSVLTDFLIKLMQLPVIYFETKSTGDIMQRMADQQKIESFLTTTTLNAVFSIFNLVIFTFLLIKYNLQVFIVSSVSTILYSGWIILFLKKRRILNYNQFENSTINQNTTIELIRGIHDIKFNNAEKYKRWNWERVQSQLFKFKVSNLSLSQYQQSGASFINQAKNIIITFLTVTAVIKGELTIGGMMAIQYIVMQLNTPIEQILGFMQNFQDAKISLERLNEVFEAEDEEPANQVFIEELPIDLSITFKEVSFKYPGAGNDFALKDVNLYIPEGKITAIVGASGGGKTTLLKLLMRTFTAEVGEITIGHHNLANISFKLWREQCGAVTQDGYIFSDTIANNICLSEDIPDSIKLENAIRIANLNSFIERQPFGLSTQIGAGGQGISQGQKQRILIARAIYKNPHYLFLDEATNCLDANNELIIMENLARFYKDRTIIIIAHRLNTVINAHNILVINAGRVSEQGSHESLMKINGEYYSLVKNQLEM